MCPGPEPPSWRAPPRLARPREDWKPLLLAAFLTQAAKPRNPCSYSTRRRASRSSSRKWLLSRKCACRRRILLPGRPGCVYPYLVPCRGPRVRASLCGSTSVRGQEDDTCMAGGAPAFRVQVKLRPRPFLLSIFRTFICGLQGAVQSGVRPAPKHNANLIVPPGPGETLRMRQSSLPCPATASLRRHHGPATDSCALQMQQPIQR